MATGNSNFQVQGEDFDRRYVSDYELVISFENSEAWAVGSSLYGQLGDGTTVSKSSPVSVLNSSRVPWKSITTGLDHVAAIRVNGTAWCWGDGTLGLLGNGSTLNRSSPVSVVGGLLWRSIAGAGSTTHGIAQNGSWYSWGSGALGALGSNATANRSSPVTVSGGGVNWLSVFGTANGASALQSDGTIWSTGVNSSGTIGDGTTTNRSSPVSVVGGGNWVKLATSSGAPNHVLALKNDGVLWAWGQNINGALGDGTTVNKSSPVSVRGGFTDWRSACAGRLTSAAIRQNGTLWTWGYNGFGQLGDGTTVNKSSPVSVAGGGTTWLRASIGELHAAAIKTDGTLWTWGDNSLAGQLGNNSTVSRSSPNTIAYSGISWISVAVMGDPLGGGNENTIGIGG